MLTHSAIFFRASEEASDSTSGRPFADLLSVLDEAEAIAGDILEPEYRETITRRISRLEAAIRDLESNQNNLDLPVQLQPRWGMYVTVPLRRAPEMLRLLRATA